MIYCGSCMSGWRTETHAENIVTLRTSVSVPTATGHYVPRLRWFTLIDADTVLTDRAKAFAEF